MQAKTLADASGISDNVEALLSLALATSYPSGLLEYCFVAKGIPSLPTIPYYLYSVYSCRFSDVGSRSGFGSERLEDDRVPKT